MSRVDRDEEQGPPPWDSERGHAFAAWVVARRGPIDTLDAALGGHPRTPGEALDAFAAARVARSEREGPGRVVEAEVPARVGRALKHCQKPFQLWNVNRIEQTYDFELKPGPELKVGGAASLPEELRPPRQLEKATAALMAWIDDQAFEAMIAKGNRERARRVWREPLPFGKPDPRPAPAEPPPGAQHPGPRPEGPPGPRPGSPPGGSPFPGFPPPGGSPFPGFPGLGGLSNDDD